MFWSSDDYKNSKYKFNDLSEKSKYTNYPMCLKLSSERQTRWTCELILKLAKKQGLNIIEETSTFVIRESSLKAKRKV